MNEFIEILKSCGYRDTTFSAGYYTRYSNNQIEFVIDNKAGDKTDNKAIWINKVYNEYNKSVRIEDIFDELDDVLKEFVIYNLQLFNIKRKGFYINQTIGVGMFNLRGVAKLQIYK